MNLAIDARDLTYAYGKEAVLKGVSFSVQNGDFFIIIGPNGSGKTTLMKVLAGIVNPVKGRLALLERPALSYTRKTLAKTIAFVPQAVPLDFPFTVAQIVLMGRAPHLGILGLEQKKDFDIARQAMAFTGVQHLADRRLDHLSGGERQCVFIARAICQQPQILLLDEPTASLDFAHQVRIMDLMEQLREENGVTLVMVSHDVNLAAMYGTRLLLLDRGRVAQLGPPAEVLRSQTLEPAYGCALWVDESPLGKFPRVMPIPLKFRKPGGYS
ncbi:MAG: ABC transporter ATP-binding protein [Desulfobacterales bacterium]|nr:ABC transporter ATP-binding protein [Desulfobacterales bacterium]